MNRLPALVPILGFACTPYIPVGDDSAILETTDCFAEEGGRIDVMGATLEIPTNALFQEVCLTLRHETEAPTAWEVLGPVVSITADRAAQLERPYTLSVAFQGELGTSHPVRNDGGDWIRVGDSAFEQVVMSNGRARIQSYFAGSVTVISVPEAECTTDLDCDQDDFCAEDFTCIVASCEVDPDCDEGYFCLEDFCEEGCEVDADCAEYGVVCGVDGFCEFVECEIDADCDAGQHCNYEAFEEEFGGICIPEDWDDDDEDELEED